MRSNGKNISLTPYDDIFSTEESRTDSMRETIQDIPLKDLYPSKIILSRSRMMTA